MTLLRKCGCRCRLFPDDARRCYNRAEQNVRNVVRDADDKRVLLTLEIISARQAVREAYDDKNRRAERELRVLVSDREHDRKMVTDESNEKIADIVSIYEKTNWLFIIDGFIFSGRTITTTMGASNGKKSRPEKSAWNVVIFLHQTDTCRHDTSLKVIKTCFEDYDKIISDVFLHFHR